VSAIAEHSSGFAAAVDGNLDAEVEHCPGWTIADLVAHHATGGTLVIAAPVAADAIEEFLTFSVSNDDDPAEPARPALRGRVDLETAPVPGDVVERFRALCFTD